MKFLLSKPMAEAEAAWQPAQDILFAVREREREHEKFMVYGTQ